MGAWSRLENYKEVARGALRGGTPVETIRASLPLSRATLYRLRREVHAETRRAQSVRDGKRRAEAEAEIA